MEQEGIDEDRCGEEGVGVGKADGAQTRKGQRRRFRLCGLSCGFEGEHEAGKEAGHEREAQGVRVEQGLTQEHFPGEAEEGEGEHAHEADSDGLAFEQAFGKKAGRQGEDRCNDNDVRCVGGDDGAGAQCAHGKRREKAPK